MYDQNMSKKSINKNNFSKFTYHFAVFEKILTHFLPI